MNAPTKVLLGTIFGFLAAGISWIVRAQKVQSRRNEIGVRATEPRHW
ncbi:MAG TPA: hypothetical protein VKZ61_09840 [Thermomicrobiales bacterium]|jgi:hypothetical protein|nr:hypothetical protein [Thermomicrobiales bacterium]